MRPDLPFRVRELKQLGPHEDAGKTGLGRARHSYLYGSEGGEAWTCSGDPTLTT